MPTQDEILKTKWDARIIIPNFLSTVRLLLLPFGLHYIHENNALFAILLFSLIALTDALDGVLARRWSCTSKVGKALDHVVDKTVFLSVTFALCLWRDFPIGAFVFLLVRELATFGVGGYFFLQGRRLEPNAVGRFSGFFFSLVLLSYFLRWPFRKFILWISLALLFIASLNYMRLYIIKMAGVSDTRATLTINAEDSKGENESRNI